MPRLAVCLTVLAIPSILCARAWHVPLDAPTLAAALAQSAAGDSVLLAPGDYHEQGLVIGHGLTLAAADPAGGPVVLHADGQPILAVEEAEGLVMLDGLVLRGSAGSDPEDALVYATMANGVVLRSCALEAVPGAASLGLGVGPGANVIALDARFLGSAETSASQVAVLVEGTLLMGDCEISGYQSTTTYSGLVHATGSATLRMTDCRIHGNQGANRVAVVYDSATTPLVLEGCRFENNHLRSLLDMDYWDDATARLSACVAVDNECGDGLFYGPNGLELESCVLARNRSTTRYRSLVAGGPLRLTGCSLLDNESADVLLRTEDLVMVRCLVAGNAAEGLVDASSLQVSCNLHHANLCGDWGGVLAPFAGQDGNRADNPLLRDLEGGDYRPALGSPLRPEHNSCAALLGALPPVAEPAAPHARFLVDIRSGAVPFTATFQALDSSAATSWSWDFTGDGVADAQGAQIGWTFDEWGAHDVTLTTSGAGGTGSWSLEEAILAGGRLHRVPEDWPDLATALAATLPWDTVDVACGDWPLLASLELPRGLVLRAREAGCGRLMPGEDPTSQVSLYVDDSPDTVTLLGWTLEGYPTRGLRLAVVESPLRLEACTLRGNLQVDVARGVLELSACVLDSLQGMISSTGTYLSTIRAHGCRITNCRNLFLISDSLELSHCQVEGGGHLCYHEFWDVSDRLAINQCTFVDVEDPLACNHVLRLDLHGNNLVGCRGGLLPADAIIDTLSVSRTNIWGGTAGDWTGPLAPFFGQNGNLSADPLFCDGAGGDFHLAEDSPCLPADGSEPLGALPRGCDWAMPQALFDVSVDTGPAPLGVQFTNRSRGGVDSWSWDLDGDGDEDTTAPNPWWTYGVAGLWQPRLEASGPGGEASLTGRIRVGGRTIRVPEDVATVAAALELAAPADTVVVGCGAWHEHGLVLRRGVVLRGAEPGCAILDGDQQGGILTLEDTAGAGQIQDLIFRRGLAARGGAIHADNNAPGSSSLLVRGCDFQDNQATSLGGAIYERRTDLRLENCHFAGNEAGSNGGALYTFELQAQGCRFEENRARHGGGIYSIWGPVLEDCAFVGNRAQAQGGGLWMDGALIENPVLDHCLFAGNRAAGYGAAVYGLEESHVRDCTFSRDSTASTQGVLHVIDDTALATTFERCIIADADAGRAITWTGNGVPSLDCSNIWGNPGGNWTGSLSNQLPLNGNLQVDPLFCAPDSLDFTLEEDSPCRAEASPCGGMGARSGPCVTALEPPGGRPTGFALFPAVPNPFNPRTTLRFRLERAGPARLAVHNLLGQRVLLLHDGELPAGEHVRVLEAGPLASGVYVATLESGGLQASRKLVVLK